jgi:hypothetical protein
MSFMAISSSRYSTPIYDERCFLPIHVYDTATSRPVAVLLRPGKTPSGTEVRGHLRRLVRRIRRHWPQTRITIRGDSHYGRPEVMEWCDENRIDFVFGRAVAIGQLVDASAAAFLANEGALSDGEFSGEIIYLTRFANELRGAITLAKDKLYNSDRKTKLEIAGSEIIRGLLDTFAEVVTDLANNDFDRSKLSGSSQRLARLMDGSLGPAENAYQALLCVTDFVSGMTDRFAVETYRTLKGIAI